MKKIFISSLIVSLLTLVSADVFAVSNIGINQESVLTNEERDRLLASTSGAIACLTVQEQGSDKEIFAGTGFFIHEAGLLLTNYHVICRTEKVFAQAGGRHAKAQLLKVIFCDQKRDYCVLQFPVEVAQPLSVRSDSLPQTGEKVYTLGFVGGCDNLLISSGNFIGRDEIFKQDFLTATTVTVIGNSGGPIVDHDGHAIGIVAGSLPDRDPVETYAIPLIDTLNVDLTQEIPLSELTERSPMLSFSLGLRRYEQGKYIEAVNALTEALEAGPDSDIYFQRGLAFYKLGRLNESLSDMNDAIDIVVSDRDRSRILTLRGLVYKDKKVFTKALEDFNRAIELEPQNATAYHDRGLLYDLKGDHIKAIADYSEAVVISPQLANAYYDRGLTYQVEEGDIDKAITDYSKVIELDPNHKSAYWNRAVAYYQKGDISRSRSDAMRAKELGATVDEGLIEKLGL